MFHERLTLSFDPHTGSLTSLSDSTTGHDFIDSRHANHLWEIDWSGTTGQPPLQPSDAQTFHWRKSNHGVSLDLVWEHFAPRNGLSEDLSALRVVVTVSLLKNDTACRWTIALEHLGSLKPIAVRFPRLPAIAPQPEEVLAVPVWMGERTSRARELLTGSTGGRFEWEYPGMLSMQCLAFYRKNGPGLFVTCNDARALAKRFALFGTPEHTVGLEITHLPASDSTAQDTYRPAYQVTLGTFQGDWFTVAERYRRWGLQQSWAKHSRLHKHQTASWVMDTGLWVWNRGRSDGVLDPALHLQDKARIPASVFWHWWHGCAYDAGFPEYLPPREGNETFQSALRHAQDQGIHALVYMNQRLWGMTTESWTREKAEQYAVKNPDGKVQPEIYNTYTHTPCASMCMGTSFWRNKYVGLASEAVTRLGVDGIYMDQACSSLACYDATHGHPLGGGSYWMKGFRLLQADIRKRCADTRPVVLAGEGCGETWLPYLDVMLSLQVSMERYAAPGDWEPIPFFHAVYHGYGVFFGNYSSLARPPYDDLWPPEFAPKEPLKPLDRKFSGQFRLEQARALVWGQQPTIANFQDRQLSERDTEMDYVVRLANLRYNARKFLLYGKLLSLFENTGDPALALSKFPMDFSRLSIYAGQQEAVKEFQKNTPLVLASAWQAPDGAIAVVVANTTNTQQVLSLLLDPTHYPIPKESIITGLNSSGKRIMGSVTENPLTLHVNLSPTDAALYTFEPTNTKTRIAYK